MRASTFPATSSASTRLVNGGDVLIPPAAISGSRLGPFTIAIVAFAVYLWVVHSQKLPIAQAAIIAGLFAVLAQSGSIRVPPPLVWFGAYAAWAFLTHFGSPFPEEARKAAFDYAKLWLIFLFAANVARSRGELRTVVVLWLAIFALYPVRGTLFNFVFGIATWDRFAWNFIFENPNDLAALTLPIVAMSAALLHGERRGWIRWAALAGVFLLPAIIVMTQSRGGILALAAFGAMLWLSQRQKGRGLVAGALVLGLILAVAPQGVWSRLGALRGVTSTGELRAVDREGSADQRFEIWKVAITVIGDQPLTGVGIGAYPWAHNRYSRQSQFKVTAQGFRDPHSTYLNVAAETGFPGFVMFAGMILSVVLPAWRTARRLPEEEQASARQLRVLVFGLVAFLLACVFATMDSLPFLYLYLAVTATATGLAGTGRMPTPAGHAGALQRTVARRRGFTHT